MILFAQNAIGQDLEALKILWPEEYKWKIIANQEDDGLQMLQLVPETESAEKWTIMGSMMSAKGVKNPNLENVMRVFRDAALQESPKAVLTFIEKDEKATFPWLLFKIESPNFPNDPIPESQLYYIVQGNTSLYSTFVGIKEESLSAEFIEKWSKIFKSSVILKL